MLGLASPAIQFIISEALDLLRPAQAGAMADRTSQSFFLHLWNEVLRRFHVSKMMLPPRGSFLRAIAERHPVEGWSGEYDVDVLEHAIVDGDRATANPQGDRRFASTTTSEKRPETSEK